MQSLTQEQQHSSTENDMSDLKFRKLASILPIGVLYTDADGKPIHANSRWCEITELSHREIDATTWYGLIHPEDRERVLKCWQDATRAGERFREEHRIVTPDGKVLWVVEQAVADVDETGKLQGFISTLTDVTGRKRMHDTLVGSPDQQMPMMDTAMLETEQIQQLLNAMDESMRDEFDGAFLESQIIQQALSDTERRNQMILETAHDAFVSIDEHSIIHEWNTRAEQMFGWSHDEAVGKPVAETIIPEAMRHAHNEGIHQFLETGEGKMLNKQVEMSARHRDGHEIPIEICISPMVTGGSYIFNAFIRDISERKRAQAVQAEHESELARSNAELQQFAYIASHDLQAPLRTVASFLQLLQKRYTGKLDDKADQFIHHAVAGAQRMQGLILDLLSYSRVGSAEREFGAVDCNEVLKELQSDLGADIGDSGVVLKIADLPVVNGDAVQIKQLFQNLLGNAFKFRKPDMPHEVTIEANQVDGMWQISVQDNGIGIDPKFSERIFAVFQKLHKPEEYAGTGIGLAICKKIVERHGGRISVESAPGEGCKFIFTLPKFPAQHA